MANEIDTAEPFLREVLDVCRRFAFRDVRFLAVLDNASRDGTIDLIRRLEKSLPELSLVFAPENKGVVDAYLRGYREALERGADWILEIDAGYSHRPAEIPRFIAAMQSGAACVFGTRFRLGGIYEGGLGRRYLVSRAGGLLANLLLGTRLSDMTSGFQLFSRAALQHVLRAGIQSRGPFFQTEMKTHAHALAFAEVPITYRPTAQSVRPAAIGDALQVLWRLFGRRLRHSIGGGTQQI